MSEALAGVLVVDMSGSVATTYCAKLFADYGATVINLETAQGFPTRQLRPFTKGPSCDSAMHGYLNADKKSVRLDFLSDSAVAKILSCAD